MEAACPRSTALSAGREHSKLNLYMLRHFECWSF